MPSLGPREAHSPNRQLRSWFRQLTREASGASSVDKGFSTTRQVAVILATGTFMALAGPFGTGVGPLWIRLAYWLGLMTAGTLMSNLVVRLALSIDLFDRRPWLWAALVAVGITPPLTVLVWAASRATFRGAVRTPNIADVVLPVVVVTCGMLALTVLTQRTPLRTHAAPPGSPPSAFLDRLPPKLRGASLYAVQAEDHYLRLHTSLGQDIILMRLTDALVELEGMEGAQVHRSWWVAREAVIDAARGNGRAGLTLKGGVIAPVSRTYARSLREAGWY